MEKQLKKLESLSSDIKSAVSDISGSKNSLSSTLFSTTGRHAMRANFQNWTVNGTRPKSDRGVTFHFKHSFVTKGRHIAKSYTDQTPAAAHQSYIERASAVEKTNEFIWNEVDETLKETKPIEPDSNQKENDQLTENDFVYPETHYDKNLMSFGTLGETKSERADFWRQIETVEGRRGRVQCRTIIELPYELNDVQRLKIARDFCRVFEDRNLPYWCSLHEPSGHNDKRNYHLHMVYYDRPSKRTIDGKWDFATGIKKKGKNRVTKTVYPFKANKDRDAQGKNWIKLLRRRYADISNYHLALAGIDKRYDPRSYAESGIRKEPTKHLGTKSAIVETYGIDTKRGTENAKKEARFRIGLGQHIFDNRKNHINTIAARIQRLQDQLPDENLHKNVSNLLNEYLDLTEEGSSIWQKKSMHEIAKEAVTLRMNSRINFLNDEQDRLIIRPPKGKEVDSWMIASIMSVEQELIKTTRNELKEFVQGCTKNIAKYRRRLNTIDQRQELIQRELLEQERLMMTQISNNLGVSDILDISSIQDDYELAFLIEKNENEDHIKHIKTDDPFNIGNIENHEDLSEAVDRLNTLRDTDEESEEVSSIIEHSQDELTKPIRNRKKKPGRKAKTTPKDKELEKKVESISGRIADLPLFKTSQENIKKTDNTVSKNETKSKTQTTKETKKQENISPEDAAINAFLGAGKKDSDKKESNKIIVFKNAMTLPSTERKDINAFEKTLINLSNTELRKKAFSTRDAADLIEDPKVAKGHQAAYEIIKDHAKRRGFDLDTGIHDPAKATDPKMANIHKDEDRTLPQLNRGEQRIREI